jgi:hypothetical protein
MPDIMSVKMHILIVSIIVFVMFLAWQVLVSMQQAKMAAATAAAPDSPYSIEMISAGYAGECFNSNDAYEENQAPAPLKKDPKTLQILAGLCNKKIKCSVPVNKNITGGETAPCMSRELHVEYRCFAVDRPWKVSAREGGVLEMECAQH